MGFFVFSVVFFFSGVFFFSFFLKLRIEYGMTNIERSILSLSNKCPNFALHHQDNHSTSSHYFFLSSSLFSILLQLFLSSSSLSSSSFILIRHSSLVVFSPLSYYLTCFFHILRLPLYRLHFRCFLFVFYISCSSLYYFLKHVCNLNNYSNIMSMDCIVRPMSRIFFFCFFYDTKIICKLYLNTSRN